MHFSILLAAARILLLVISNIYNPCTNQNGAIVFSMSYRILIRTLTNFIPFKSRSHVTHYDLKPRKLCSYIPIFHSIMHTSRQKVLHLNC